MDEVPLPPDLVTPEQVLQSRALRDWIRAAVETLSPTLRLPVVLRYFSTGITSYQQIAEACAVPVGTVRSRLSQARTKPALALETTTATAHEDVARRAEAGWHEVWDTLSAAELGEFGKVVRDRYSPDVSLPTGKRLGGARLLLAGMDSDLSAGVRQRPLHIVAGRSLVVREMELINPRDDPYRCPPGVAWIMTPDSGRVSRISLHHAPRPEQRSAPAAVWSRSAGRRLPQSNDPAFGVCGSRSSCLCRTVI
ncbi:RNA polymerase sigma factor [Streptomyces sp. NRRL B-24572]|uniref:RNA polymerase sigma factor n=1 Tax=Streptomyces sp. NRRL B-24572 TaxID=1962156 RepID=UPI00277D144D|nr:sigma factor-like helix-turn-helix DNA-binding protein [Streptomyces sp. NRRL B-24572]